MAAANTVKVTFLGDADSLARAARMAQGQMDKVATSVGKASKVGTFFGAAAGSLAVGALGKVQSFAQGSVDAFAAIEDATGAAQVQFGDAADDVVAFAESASKSLGLSKRAALDAQNTFGTLGKAAGLADAPLANFSRKMTSLAGDLASFKGTSTEQAIDAVGAALRGETEPIRAYGVLLDQASIEAEAMSIGLLKATKNVDLIKEAHTRAGLAQVAYNNAVKEHGEDSTEAERAQLALGSATRALEKATAGSIPPLTQQQKVLASQSLILKQTTDAQGDFARTSASTANVQKTLAAETENAQAKLGQQLAPALTAVRQLMLQGIKTVSGLASGISGLANFVDHNRSTFAAFAAVVTAVVLPAMIKMAIQWTVTATAATVSAAKQAAAWLLTQMSAYKALVATGVAFAAMIAGWIRAGAVAMAQAARMAAAWIISMGPIAIAIAAVVGAVVLIIKNWDKIKAATAKAWAFVKDAVKKAIDAVIFVLTNFTGPGLIIKHFDKIVATIKGVPAALKNAAREFVQAGIDLIAGMIQGIIQKAKELPGIVKDKIVDSVKNTIKSGFGIFSPSRVGREYGQNVAGSIGLGLTDKQQMIQDRAQAMVDKLKDKLADVRSFAKDIRDAFRDLGDVTNIDTALADGGDGGFLGLLDGLRKRAADAQKFASAMAMLRKQGLNQSTLDQLREAGPEGGLTAANNLLAGGMGGIGEVNRLMAQINQVGKSFAETEAKTKFGISPNAKLTGQDVRVIIDPRGGEDDFKKWIRKWIRAEGGDVQKVLGKV